MSIDNPWYAPSFLNVIPSNWINVGVVAEDPPMAPYVWPSSSSVTATAVVPVVLCIIVLSGPSPTKCA